MLLLHKNHHPHHHHHHHHHQHHHQQHHHRHHCHQPDLSEVDGVKCEAAATLVAGGFNRFNSYSHDDDVYDCVDDVVDSDDDYDDG